MKNFVILQRNVWLMLMSLLRPALTADLTLALELALALLLALSPPLVLEHKLDGALLAQTADNVDLKDGLLSNRVCTLKFPVVEDYF